MIDYNFIKALENRLINTINWRKWGSGNYVMNEDWDNLIILDACRFDYFNEICNVTGDLEYRVSRGSSSQEFMKNNFFGRELHDTIYVTGNPFVADLPSNTFHATITAFDSWDDELETIHPESIAELAYETANEFPKKRQIIHFMQPHEPYIGSLGREVTNRVNGKGWSPRDQEDKEGRQRVIRAAQSGQVSDENLRQIYKENLKLVFEVANKLIESLTGRTIITADHGELLGEHLLYLKRYEHPVGLYCKELRKVPWYIIEGESRRTVTSDPPVNAETFDEKEIEQRLEALGYR